MDTISTNIAQKKLLVFDWDGTLFNSVGVKGRNFLTILQNIVSQKYSALDHEKLLASYKKYSGLPRRQILASMCKELNIDICEHLEEFFATLTLSNLAALKKREVFPDAIRFLDKLLEKKHYVIGVSSATPQDELQILVKQKLLPNLKDQGAGVQFCFGTSDNFRKGKEHLTTLMEKYNVEKSLIVTFGDDQSDVDLANDFGVECVLLNREQKKVVQCKNIIVSFDDMMI